MAFVTKFLSILQLWYHNNFCTNVRVYGSFICRIFMLLMHQRTKYFLQLLTVRGQHTCISQTHLEQSTACLWKECSTSHKTPLLLGSGDK